MHADPRIAVRGFEVIIVTMLRAHRMRDFPSREV